MNFVTKAANITLIAGSLGALYIGLEDDAEIALILMCSTIIVVLFLLALGKIIDLLEDIKREISK